MQNQKREFTGVWIPRAIIEDENLKPADKILYAEIACYKVCFKKREELMKICGVGRDAFQDSCRRLEAGGYISQERKFGKIYRTALTGLPHQLEKPTDEQPENPVVEQPENPVDERTENPAVHLDNTKENTIENTDPFSGEKGERNELKKTLNPEEIQRTKVKKKNKQEFLNERRAERGKPPMTPRTPTDKQRTAMLVFREYVDYFKAKGYEQHGMQFMEITNDKRNMVVRKLMLSAHDKIGDLRPLIDWWFEGEGEWADYEPEQCFSVKILERYKNKDKRKKKGGVRI